MANADTPFGAKPVGHLQGVDWSAKAKWYLIPATDSTAGFLYDLVTLAGSASTDGRFATVKQAAAADTALLGAAIAYSTSRPDEIVGALAGGSTIPYDVTRTASVATYVLVTDDPYVIYEMQEDSVGNDIAATMVGLATDIVVGTGSTTTGLSAMELDSSDTGTAAGQMRILGLSPKVDGSNLIGTNAKWLCTINEHAYKGTADV